MFKYIVKVGDRWYVRGCSFVLSRDYADHYNSKDEAQKIAIAKKGVVETYNPTKLRIYFGY